LADAGVPCRKTEMVIRPKAATMSINRRRGSRKLGLGEDREDLKAAAA